MHNCLQDCGHDAVNDEALFSSMPRLGEASARPSSGLTGLAFDERMTMHAEQSSAPHPERPDRIRAVIARLQASSLAGELATPACVSTCTVVVAQASKSYCAEQGVSCCRLLCRVRLIPPWNTDMCDM